MSHLSAAILRQKLAAAQKLVTVGAQYRHYRGGEYIVREIALLESQATPAVVYQKLNDELVWVRPLEDWLATVTLEDGRRVPRFKKTS